jgi:hypothetical protein
MVLVSLVGIYLGLWDATKRYGVRELSDPLGLSSLDEPLVYDSRALLPLVVVDREEATMQYMKENGISGWSGPPMTQTSHYLWLFGPRFCLARTYDGP